MDKIKEKGSLYGKSTQITETYDDNHCNNKHFHKHIPMPSIESPAKLLK